MYQAAQIFSCSEHVLARGTTLEVLGILGLHLEKQMSLELQNPGNNEDLLEKR